MMVKINSVHPYKMGVSENRGNNMHDDTPLYLRIKSDIIQKIQSQELKPGMPINTEAALCKEYDVSRVTIRKAIGELIGENVLVRDFGKRPIVNEKPLKRNVSNRLNSLHEEADKNGTKCSSYILSKEIMVPPEKVCQKMGLLKDEQVVYIERLRYIDGLPVCYQELYLNRKLFPDLDEKRLVMESLYKIIESEYGVRIEKAEQTISAVLSSYRVTAMLELSDQVCMLKVDRTAYSDKKECIEYSETQYVASRYNIEMVLWR